MKQESPSRSETTLIVDIPDDLLEEILHRLPLRYLVRCKSVSKRWNSLIESNHLAEKHTRLRQKKYGAQEINNITVEWSDTGGFDIKYNKPNGLVATNGESSEELIRVAGSCNGLVCVHDLVYVYLLNPLTRVTRTLTPPLGTKFVLTPPGDTKLSVGFGRDIVRGTYKVVAMYSFDNGNIVKTLVFDLSTSKWRRRYKTAGSMPLSCDIIVPERNPVFVNGSLFWLLARDHSEILVMDLHTEKFRTVRQPNEVVASLGHLYMWYHEDRLCLSNFRQGFDVWVLVQGKGSERWKRMRFGSIDAVLPPFRLNNTWFSPSLVCPYQLSSYSSRQRHSIPLNIVNHFSLSLT
ncbi:unnamed protein product [Cochlearia groenlandica]